VWPTGGVVAKNFNLVVKHIKDLHTQFFYFRAIPCIRVSRKHLCVWSSARHEAIWSSVAITCHSYRRWTPPPVIEIYSISHVLNTRIHLSSGVFRGGAIVPWPPLWLSEIFFEGLEEGWTGRWPPPSCGSGLSGPKIGGKLEKVTKKKKKKKRSSSWSLSKKRSTDVSFPKKGRQLFVAVKMAPPFVNF
jgi:hypothetical protein